MTDDRFELHTGDARAILAGLPTGSVDCVVTSPPYFGLRDYGVAGQIGLEPSIGAYLDALMDVFGEVWRVLADHGTLWLNLGDSYATRPNGPPGEFSTLNGSRHAPWESRKARAKRGGPGVPSGLKHKDLIGVPWRVAFALQEAGWYLRSDVVWQKPNTMPESVADRPTRSHEYLFLLAKRERYYYDAVAIMEPVTGTAKPRGDGVTPKAREATTNVRANARFSAAVNGLVNERNRRTVWTIANRPFSGAHFATYPPELVEPCVLAGTSAAGNCARCGTPWRRVVERYRTLDGERCDTVPAMRSTSKAVPVSHQGVGHQRTGSVRSTVGWEPGCECGPAVPAVPAVVLDPFAGAGTTGLVALAHGRRFVGVELNPEYAAIARDRIASGGRRVVRHAEGVADGQLAIFQGAP